METLKTGDFAYYDAFDGLIPCKVTHIAGVSGIASTSQTITAIITASKGAWRKGEQIMSSGLRTVPRGAVRVRSGQLIIRAHNVSASSETATPANCGECLMTHVDVVLLRQDGKCNCCATGHKLAEA